MAAEHLLWALLEHATAWRVKLPPPCREELRAFVAQEIDRLPALLAYRDVPTPALAKEVVDALRPNRWKLFEKPLPPKEMMQRLTMVPRVRDWLAWAAMDDLLVDEAVDEASALAGQRGHHSIKTDHFLRVLADQHWLGAPPSLASVLDERLAAVEPPVPSPSLGEDLSVLVAKAKIYARMVRRAPTSDILLCIALREEAVEHLFRKAGIDAETLRQRLAHGGADVSVAPERGMVEVVFHDDDFTPIELVKELMERKFRLEPAEARTAIATIEDDGEAVVATLPAEEAILLVDEARGRAREMRLPFRITLRAVG